MNRVLFPLLLLLLPFVSGCRSSGNKSDSIVSIQIIDRNGFSETISNEDRLSTYENVNFLASQPFQKVLRVYGKNSEGKSHSKLTSYHNNGGVWQLLEAVNGRANGRYLEWHENGTLKIEAHVIEGLADLGINAQKSWLFDKESLVWDERGHLEAEFLYELGSLNNQAKYYFPSGKIKKTIPYFHGVIEGTLFTYDEEGEVLEEIFYKQGVKEGAATGYWVSRSPKYQEQYREGLLINASYFDPQGNPVAEIEGGIGIQAVFEGENLYSLIEFQGGSPDGIVKLFSPKGELKKSYTIKEGQKTGEEWEYYLSSSEEPSPKLMVTWYEDVIQGMAKTWYPNGTLQAQREMSNNKKEGLSFAYYENGDLMLMEEYEKDKLLKGSYYKEGESKPVSTIEEGEGVATLFNKEGYIIQKIDYERGKPVVE
ncbi:MAG: hypothetical protein KR126chlam1_00498 [Chlamydiae bacterium]|nr:hypothetical protein [Chlamydiota bacterium]